MINVESIDIQCKVLNKIIKINHEKLYDKNIYNKLCYLIYKDNKIIVDYMESINEIHRIIYSSIECKNYKKALRYCCYLDKITKEVLEKIKIIQAIPDKN